MIAKRVWVYQVAATALVFAIVGGLALHRVFAPDPYDLQGIQDIAQQPFASAAGALLPAMVLAPLFYFGFGWTLRKALSRFRQCDQCASSISVEAKKCRYCGRLVQAADGNA